MTGTLRRILTALGTGAALIGATAAVQSAQGAQQTVQPSGQLRSAAQKEAATAAALRRAIGLTQSEDTVAKASVAALEIVLASDRTMAASRVKVAAAPASVSAQPVVNSSTGSSGSSDDSGSSGGDD